MQFIWGWIISLLFEFNKKHMEYEVGSIRSLITFTNGKKCEVTIIGEVSLKREAISGDDTYPLEYTINNAIDIFHSFLEKVDKKHIDFIVADSSIYYRLDQNEVDEIRLMNTDSHKIIKTVYDRVRK